MEILQEPLDPNFYGAYQILAENALDPNFLKRIKSLLQHATTSLELHVKLVQRSSTSFFVKVFGLSAALRQIEKDYKAFEQFGESVHKYLDDKIQSILGLTKARIQQFDKYQADESMVGDECAVCLEEVEVGRRMMRLDCQGGHVFCQDCIESWFTEHKTCPYCNHVFV